MRTPVQRTSLLLNARQPLASHGKLAEYCMGLMKDSQTPGQALHASSSRQGLLSGKGSGNYSVVSKTVSPNQINDAGLMQNAIFAYPQGVESQ
jgi:hypothetical protein